MKIGPIKLRSIGAEWGEFPKRPDHYAFYVYWWNRLPKGHRHVGIERMYYDGPNVSLGFWFFNITWSTQWTR